MARKITVASTATPGEHQGWHGTVEQCITCASRVGAYGLEHSAKSLDVGFTRVSHRGGTEHSLKVVPNP